MKTLTRLAPAMALLAVLWTTVAGSATVAHPMLAQVTLGGEDDLVKLRGFDLTEARHGNAIDVVLWPGDEARLRATGLRYSIIDADLDATAAEPSVSMMYRFLEHYEADMRALASKYPSLVRLILAPHQTIEGRSVYGLEIAADVARRDGRPTSFVMGLHHAREWPSAELPMDFAIDLANGYGTDPRITALLDAVRVLIVPVVNPDGFVTSRGFPVDGREEMGIVAGGQGAYWRKNRRGVAAPLKQPIASYGVDPNRNYSFQWGSGKRTDVYADTSGNRLDQTYQGKEPFSEAETQNVRDLALGYNVTTLLTNHTYGNSVLWPWGYTNTDAPDRSKIVALGKSLASAARYIGMQSVNLYPTTGTTEDWAYATLGTIGFTMEHGSQFHGPYPTTMPAMRDRTRESFLRLVEAAADTSLHSVISGLVQDADGRPITAELRLTKTVQTPLWDQAPTSYETIAETIDVAMETDPDGAFTWHVNPSRRPIGSAGEVYTLRVSAPGFAAITMPVSVARGEALSLGTITLQPA